jgi:secreted trypsin-like serine protease
MLDLFVIDVAACTGDSGGGLIIKKDSKWFLRGIVSFGISKRNELDEAVCDEKYPSLYADLGNSVDWIVDQLANT